MIAIFYTGMVRTMSTTIGFFKKNVLKSEEYHVFAVLQYQDDYLSHESFVRETLGNNLKQITWLDKNNEKWVHMRNHVETMPITDLNKDYLKTSGSMIEYYQAYLAFQAMIRYEEERNIHYDFIMRFRTDTVLKDDICFTHTRQSIEDTIRKIQEKTGLPTIINQTVLEMFMRVFMIPERIKYDCIQTRTLLSGTRFHDVLECKEEQDFLEALFDYVQHGSYFVSLRENLIYFMKRQDFTKICNLGLTYGQYYVAEIDDGFWWNAESQLRCICFLNQIDYFSSTTCLEDLSVYNYESQNYYEKEGELKKGDFSCFIKRH